VKISAISGSKVIGDIAGNAATATIANRADLATTANKLATPRKINNVNFDGSADINITAIADAESLSGTNLNPLVTGSSLTSVGTLANLTVTNPIVGDITGNANTAISATIAGTASTATKLATPRKINDIDFDGSADIAIPAKFTKDVTVKLGKGKTLGKYADGTIISTTGKTLDEFLLDIVTESVPPTYLAPTVTIASNKSSSYEIGSNLGTVTLSNTYTQRNGGEVATTTYFQGLVALKTNTVEISSLTSPVSFSVRVDYNKGPILKDNLGNDYPTGQILAGSVTSSNLTITPFANKYYGTSETNAPTDADIIGQSKEQATSKAKATFTINVSGGSKYAFYAYPATLGLLSSINVGGIESIDAFTLTTKNVINGSGFSQSYHIYTSNNSTSSSVSNITIN
jgi:hypothetical protein